jgi:hypothetical protein
MLQCSIGPGAVWVRGRLRATPPVIHVLLIEPDPLLREIISDLADQAQMQVVAAVAGMDEARAALGAQGRVPPAPLVLVVAARLAYGRTVGTGDAEWRRLPHREDDAGPAAPGPAGVVYFGEHAPAHTEGADPRERFLAVPFGRDALAAAVYGVAGQPVPRWLEPRRREARPGVPEAGR